MASLSALIAGYSDLPQGWFQGRTSGFIHVPLARVTLAQAGSDAIFTGRAASDARSSQCVVCLDGQASSLSAACTLNRLGVSGYLLVDWRTSGKHENGVLKSSATLKKAS